MTRALRVLLAQLAPATHDAETNATTVCTLLDEHPDADLAVFPELFLQAYALPGIAPVDLDAGGPVARIALTARRARTAVVVGTAERSEVGMWNSALCIDEHGEVAARYRKVHLYGEETRFFEPGDTYVVARLAGIDVGVLICYDVEFPEASRALATAGAQLLVTLSANMTPYGDAHALFVRVRALENRLPHIYVNCVGKEGRLEFCGGSSVADTVGTVRCELAGFSPDVRVVEVPVGERGQDDGWPDYLADRRPEVQVGAVAGNLAGMAVQE
jgi:(R)-amidase